MNGWRISARKGRAVLAAISLAVTAAGCATRPDPPAWAANPPQLASGMAVVGMSHPAADRRAALGEARRDALKRFLERMGMEVAVYTRSITRNRGVGDGAPRASSETRKRITWSTEAFLKRVRQRDQWVAPTDDGRYTARVMVHVPEAEVARVRAYKKRQREAEWKPALRRYRTATARYRQFQEAVAANELGRAMRQIPEVLAAYRQAKADPTWAKAKPRIVARDDWAYPLSRGDLVQEVTDGLTVTATSAPVHYGIGTGPLRFKVTAVRGGRPAKGLALIAQAPSGRSDRVRTGSDGRAEVELPGPAHPGIYEVEVAPASPGGGKTIAGAVQSVAVHAAGESQLAQGAFHAFREARGIGRVARARVQSRAAARQRALAAARTNAIGKLVENTGDVERKTVATGQAYGKAVTRVTARGHVRGSRVRARNVRWQGGGVTASVVVGAPVDALDVDRR